MIASLFHLEPLDNKTFNKNRNLIVVICTEKLNESLSHKIMTRLCYLTSKLSLLEANNFINLKYVNISIFIAL